MSRRARRIRRGNTRPFEAVVASSLKTGAVVFRSQLFPVQHPPVPVRPQAVVLSTIHCVSPCRICKPAVSLAWAHLELLRPGPRRTAAVTQPV